MAICLMITDSCQEHQHFADSFQYSGNQQKHAIKNSVNKRKEETKYHHNLTIFFFAYSFYYLTKILKKLELYKFYYA